MTALTPKIPSDALAVTDGLKSIGHLVIRGRRVEALAPDGRPVGEFASRQEAIRALVATPSAGREAVR